MRVQLGSYFFGVNQTDLSSRVDTLFSAVGQPYEQHIEIDVKGYLLTTVTNGDSQAQQADLTQQENQLKTAAAAFQSLVFLQDNGQPSSEQMPTQLAITGNRITHLSFPRTTGPEYCTERYFELTCEGWYPIVGSQNFALSFTETLTFRGGGPIYVFKPNILGAPQKQRVYPQVAYECTQRGVIVGYRKAILPPPQRFPQALMRAPDVAYKNPERRGPGLAAYSSYETSYEYFFQSATALVAAPTIWTGTGYL